jgi:ribosome-binding factor A
MDPLRTQRVAETLREELSELVRYELTDPRVSEVDVTEVVVSPDLKCAEVLVSLGPDKDSRAPALEGLDHARHFLRHKLMERMHLHRMPELHFRPDAASTTNEPIERLFRRMRRGRAREAQNPSEN